MPGRDPDPELRLAAHEHVRRLSDSYDDLVPLPVLREGFPLRGERVSLGSFYKGIHRAGHQRGPAALCLVTSAKSPYRDLIDEETGAIIYAYRDGPLDQADNRALDAAFELQAPLIYFKGHRAWSVRGDPAGVRDRPGRCGPSRAARAQASRDGPRRRGTREPQAGPGIRTSAGQGPPGTAPVPP